MGKCYCFTLEQWFSNFSGHQDHLKGLLNYKLMDSPTRPTFLIYLFFLEWGTKLYISNMFTDTADAAGPETILWRIYICGVMDRFEDLLHNIQPFSLSRKPTHFFLLSTQVISIQIKRTFPEKQVKKNLPFLFICLLSSLWISPVLLKNLSSFSLMI